MDELVVLWLDIGTWCHDQIVEPINDPIPLSDWLHVLRNDPTIEIIAFVGDGIISSGACTGGRVVAVDTFDGRQYFALPPAALPHLAEFVGSTG